MEVIDITFDLCLDFDKLFILLDKDYIKHLNISLFSFKYLTNLQTHF